MVAKGNYSWNLQSFLDSLILELDRAQDTLSIKGMNRKLTYMVKDVSIDLNIFPQYDGDAVSFVTAQPGEVGASRMTLQLGSIRDHQIKEIAKPPLTQSDISLEASDLPKEETKALQKLGITSAADLRRTIEERNIDLAHATGNNVDYKSLAERLQQARRRQQAPSIARASLAQSAGQTVLTLEGRNLAVDGSQEGFPAALLNNKPVSVTFATDNELRLMLDDAHVRGQANQLQIALDPYAVITLQLQ